jgi:hypothetical protein
VKSVVFFVAAVLCAAFDGPTWAWVVLGVGCVLALASEAKNG